MSQIPQQIDIDELSRGLYGVHLDRKNNRICNVMRALLLRSDFQDFLKKMEKEAVHQIEMMGITGRGVKTKRKVWVIDFRRAPILIAGYIKEVSESKYFDGKDKNLKDYFLNIGSILLEQSYADSFANHKNKNAIFSNTVFIDNAQNYPNITKLFFDQETFWKVFNDAFGLNAENFKRIKEKYGRHPIEIFSGGGNYGSLPEPQKIEASRAKICQLIIDDTTEKSELIDYIDKNWGDIEMNLKPFRSKQKEKRTATSGNLLRDIDIFNKYEEYKKEGYKNPDVKVYAWLKKDSQYKTEIEPNTIRKTVSLLRKEIKEINAKNKQ